MKLEPATSETLRAFEHMMVVDLEATCWEDRRDDMETIEFGAVVLRLTDLAEVDALTWYVQPKLNTVSDFCTRLTSITQADVEDGVSFEKLHTEVSAWVRSLGSLVWGSWGEFDRTQLEKDAARCELRSPLADVPYVNLKELFWASYPSARRKRRGLYYALMACEMIFEGRQHRGIDDARNIARLVPAILDTTLIVQSAPGMRFTKRMFKRRKTAAEDDQL